MTDPTEATFSGRLNAGGRLRVAAVAVAALFLIVGGVATATASPAPGAAAPLAQSVNASQAGGPGLGGRWLQDGRGAVGFGDGGGWRHGGFGWGSISITAINGSNLSLKTADGWTRTISLTGTTTITKGGQTIKVGDLKVGDQIRFSQTRNSDGTYTINAIEVVVPTVGGTVTAVSTGGFTIKSRDGTSWTITVAGSTTYKLGTTSGAQAGSKSDVAVGTDVVVQGSQIADSALTATTVYVRLPRVAGQVSAKSGSTITIQRRDGTTATIHVDSSTTYQVRGVTNPSLADITVGVTVAVEGKQRADGSIDAAVVYGGVFRHWKSPFGPVVPGASAAPTTQG